MAVAGKLMLNSNRLPQPLQSIAYRKTDIENLFASHSTIFTHETKGETLFYDCQKARFYSPEQTGCPRL